MHANPNLPRLRKTYLMIDWRTGFIKIGSSLNPRFREGTLQAHQPQIVLLATSRRKGREGDLHRRFSRCRLRGEWFELSPSDVEGLLAEDFRQAEGSEPYMSMFLRRDQGEAGA
jgi:hypothetical protein